MPPRLRITALALASATLVIGCGARTDLALSSAPPEVPEIPESCNGVDDDGDGLVDEDIAPLRCGVGACAREVPGCAEGSVPLCTPGEPSFEVCNGLDDDCNGTADEGLGFGPVAGPYTIWEGGDVYVLETALVPTSGGMLALMRRGWNEGDSTLLVRRLDDDGVPAAPAELLPLAVATNGPNASPSTDGTIVLTYCAAVGPNNVAMAARLDSNGTVVLDDVPLAPTGRSCGAMTPGVLFTKDAHLVGWTDNSSGPPTPTQEVLLGVHDANLAAASGAEIEPEGDLVNPPRFAQRDGSVGMVYGIRRAPTPQVSEIAFQPLSPGGDLVGERTIVGVPADAAGAQWAQASLGVNALGFLVFGVNRFDDGAFRARFATDGSLLEAPTVVAGLEGLIQPITMATRPTGGFVGAGYTNSSTAGGRVFLLDAKGELSWSWESDFEDEIGWPSIHATAAGRVFVLYTAFSAPGGITVRLREFGCSP